MEYKMGVIGIGHWFKRLQSGLDAVGGIRIVKALGTKPYEAKAELLNGMGISNSNYYTINADGSIPEQFFDGIDIVHISNPNEVHFCQTTQSLSKGKKTIVEKSFAVNKKEFVGFRKFVKVGGHEKSVYLHLHYIHKMPSLVLRKSIKSLVAQHGKITGIVGTFFEPADDEDSRRGWLFDMRNGGLFLDWVHPFEVAFYSTGSRFGKISKLSLYATNESYDSKNPTGILSELAIKGKRVAATATMKVYMAKGVGEKYSRKAMVITFEDGAYAKLTYIGSEKESKDNRGYFEIGKILNGTRVPESNQQTSGKSASEFFVNDILKLCSGQKAGMSLPQLANVFKPQWEYQKISKKQALVRDQNEIAAFLDAGIRET